MNKKYIWKISVCLMPFIDKFRDQVEIEKFLLNFPEPDDTAHYPDLSRKHARFEDSSPLTNIPLMYERIYALGDRASCGPLTLLLMQHACRRVTIHI